MNANWVFADNSTVGATFRPNLRIISNMKKLIQLTNIPLEWKGDGIFKTAWTVYHDEKPIVHFRQDRGVFKADIAVYVAGEEEPLFVFVPKGVIRSSVEVESADIEYDQLATMKHRWMGGCHIHTLAHHDYEWKHKDFLGKKWEMVAVSDPETPLAQIESATLSFKGTLTLLTDKIEPHEFAIATLGGLAMLILQAQAAAG